MNLKMWSLDLAREQCAYQEHLFKYAAFSLDAGYDALGLYLEHRFAYQCAPWATGKGCLTPQIVQNLRAEFPSLQIIPMINLLGHMEGFLNCSPGENYRESHFGGMQGCPSNQEFITFCDQKLDEILSTFDSELVHIGGDETYELARCQRCAPDDESELARKKTELYKTHFGNYSNKLISKGRRPALWGDMLLEHPEALEGIPKETLLFDWQYLAGVRESSQKLSKLGHSIVACPTLHNYDAAWMQILASESNVREVCTEARELGLEGICLTTWENGLMGAYDTVLPAVKWAKTIMDDPKNQVTMITAYGDSTKWSKLMGEDLNAIGGVFAYDGHRNRLKCRLLLYGNPFLAWKHHAEQLCGDDGLRAIELCEQAIQSTDSESEKGIALFVRGAVEFVRMAQAAKNWYDQGEPDRAIKCLAPSRHAFDTLEMVAKRTHERIGGSLADIERCRIAKRHIETVIQRLRNYGHGELGYLPSFDVVSHPHFVPHDQACWWGVNRWGNE